MAADEASHIIGWDARSSRYPRGRPATAPVTLSRRRFHSLGALVDGGFECRLCDRANGDSFTGLPGHLRHKYGRLIVILDSAACHKSKKVAEFAGSCGGDIMPAYLPAYTPEPSPIEAQWRMVKGHDSRAVRHRQGDEGLEWAMMGSGEPGWKG